MGDRKTQKSKNSLALKINFMILVIAGLTFVFARFGFTAESSSVSSLKPHSGNPGMEKHMPSAKIPDLKIPDLKIPDLKAGKGGNSPANSEFCPFQTAEEWQQFLERAIDRKDWVAQCEDGPCDEKFYAFVKQNVADTFLACEGFIKSHPEIARCTDRFRKFTPAWLAQHTSDTYGFTLDNHVYLHRQDAADMPENMMVIPNAIIKALPDRDKVEVAARLNGWPYVTHDSALGGFRTFVIVSDPAGRFDQWMLLNLRDKKNEITDGTPLSILTVQKKTKSGKSLSKVRLHFRDYVIARLPAHKYQIALNETINGKCYSCHSNGVRQLIARNTKVLEALPVKGERGFSSDPEAVPSRTFGQARLVEFNRRLRSYGRPDWNGDIIPENHGPALGKSIGCTDCHDGTSRAELNLSTSVAQMEQKVIAELSMPPDSHLVDKLERKEMENPPLSKEDEIRLGHAHQIHKGLMQDFEASRFPELKAWVLASPCR